MAKRAKPGDKAPAYQWYPKDAQTDEAYKSMTHEERGVYRDLLDHQWLHGSIPSDIAGIADAATSGRARLSDERATIIWPKILPCFSDRGDGRLVNVRLERQRSETAAFLSGKSEAGRLGGLARAHDVKRRRRMEAARRRGTHTAMEWLLLLEFCGGKCVQCKATKRVQQDHIIPIYQPDSTDAIDNLQPLCSRCNQAKGADTTDFRPDGWHSYIIARLLPEASAKPASSPASASATASVVKNTTVAATDLFTDAGPNQIDSLVRLWNDTRQPGPHVRQLMPAGKRQLLGRALKAMPNLADWRLTILWVNGQTWMNAPGTGDHPSWRADLFFLAKPGKMADYLERARLEPPRATTGIVGRDATRGRTGVERGKYDDLKSAVQ